MKKFLSLLPCLFVGLVSAQSLSSSVIATQGDQYSSASGTLEWTMGEIMTETYGPNIGYLTQGFRQPAAVIVTGLRKEPNPIAVYPNPAHDELHIAPAERRNYLIEVFDLMGKTVIRSDFKTTMDTDEHILNVLSLPRAVYLLRVSDEATGESAIYKFEKY